MASGSGRDTVRRVTSEVPCLGAVAVARAADRNPGRARRDAGGRLRTRLGAHRQAGQGRRCRIRRRHDARSAATTAGRAGADAGRDRARPLHRAADRRDRRRGGHGRRRREWWAEPATDGRPAATPVSIPAASGGGPTRRGRAQRDRPQGGARRSPRRRPRPNTSHGSRKRRRLRVASGRTRGTIRAAGRLGPLDARGAHLDHRAPHRPYYTALRIAQLARFSGARAACCAAAARSFTEAAYMST